MDINMEGMGGIAATKLIRDEHKGTNVILLSTYDEEDLPADARTCGALAYIHKERFGPDILEGTWSSGGTDGGAANGANVNANGGN
jgi:DNA-binding NarL/FixJ family response regulator